MIGHLGDLVSAYLDGELDESARIDADRHLAACERCAEDLAGLSVVRSRLRDLPVLESRSHHPMRARWTWAAASIAAAALAIGLITAPGERGPAFDLDTLNDQHTARLVGDPGIATVRGSGP